MRNFRFCILAFLLLFVHSVNAQTDDEYKKDCYFVYIAHDQDSPVSQLTERIKEMGKDARRHHHPTIFYLANDESPLIVCYNIKVPGATTEEELLAQIADKLYHPVNASFDFDYICNYFKNLVLGTRDSRTFESINWNFFTTESFWKLGYNESLIASLFWKFSIKNFQDKQLNFDVYYSSDKGFHPDEEIPFGIHNFDGINKIVKPMQF